MVSREKVLETLRALDAPGGTDIVSAGRVRALNVEEGQVRFVLDVPEGEDPAAWKALHAAAARALEALDGVEAVSIVLTAQKAPAPPPPDLGVKSAPAGPAPIPGIRHIIAIASGKGGVGKSTLSANLAVAMARAGTRVGLLDADVFGPSQPRMLGVSGRPSSPDGRTIMPLRNHGVTLMSVGLMTNEDEAVIWRGPMLIGALGQMLTQVAWGELDVLVVDLPPGTGDVQMTLAQKARLDGVIVVSTPQDIALLDAKKAIDMLQKQEVPILGLVENMAWQICEECGHRGHPFGQGGVAREAEKLGLPVLAELPLALDIRVAGDSGAPVVASRPDSPEAQAFHMLAGRVLAMLSGDEASEKAP
ncbi:MAG TPA: MRP family ATP-binding protein [Aliiroseovarius sp.]|nr:MRP family ATP-binding protein [Aliiroseovarius sp.]